MRLGEVTERGDTIPSRLERRMPMPKATTDGKTESKNENDRAGFLRRMILARSKIQKLGIEIGIDIDCSGDRSQRLKGQRYSGPVQVSAYVALALSTEK
jgi:hypothetical protein